MFQTEISLVMDIGIIIVVGTVLALLFKSLKQSPIIGYIISGIILGPLGLSFISNQQEILVLSELGVAFLLFTAGIELDFDRLRKVGSISVIVALLSITSSFIIGFITSHLFGLPIIESIYIGLTVSFSSTMVVVKILVDKYKLNSLQGRLCLGILLVQDIAIIIALSFLGNLTKILYVEPMLRMVLNGLGLLSIAIILSKFFFPHILKYSAKSEELFFLISVSTCFIFIGLSSFLGFSIAIGGFIGGLALTTYPYNIEITSKMRPLRNFFTVIFFSFLGMQIGFSPIFGMLTLVLALLIILMLIKPLIMSFSLSALGYGSRVPILVGTGLAQGSEFIFILATQGMRLGHITQNIYSVVITVVLISMGLTPYLFSGGGKLSRWLSKKFPEGFHISKRRVEDIEEIENELKNHIILIGCHKTGGEILEKLEDKKIITVDHDPEIVENLREKGYSCLYGEGTNKDILKNTRVKEANFVIITIPDLEDNIYITEASKEINPEIKVIAKARNVRDALKIYKSEADLVVIPDLLAGDDISKKVKKFLKKDMEKEREKEIEKLKSELDSGFLI